MSSTARRRGRHHGRGRHQPPGQHQRGPLGGPGQRPQRRGPDDGRRPGDRARRKCAAAAEAVPRRDRRLRPAGKGAEEGHPQGAEGDVPRVPDGRGRRPTGPGRRRHRAWASSTPTGPASASAPTTCSACPRSSPRAMPQCLDAEGKFHFSRWGGEGMPKMSPLWLLKYLPNMPASHVAIYNDFRGPNNSLTLREAAANLAVGEAFQIIRRGNADAMLCGATGTRLHSMKIVHAVQQEEVACGDGDPARRQPALRPQPQRHGAGRRGRGRRARGARHAQARGRHDLRRGPGRLEPRVGRPQAGRPPRPGHGQRAAGPAAERRHRGRTRSAISTPTA